MVKNSFDIKYDEWLKFAARDDIVEFNQCKTVYKELIDKNKNDLDLLAILEETIMQIAYRNQAKDNFKLSEVRGYIYVRAPFYRMFSKAKDIRAVVGKISEYGNDLVKLYSDPEFTLLAKLKIEGVMTKKIEENIIEIGKLKEITLSL